MLTEKKDVESRQEEMVERAYELAKAAHQGKNDRGGHPYIGHPVRVSARFVADAGMQVAALLHDTVEDTPVTLETIEEAFGTEIRNLVEGLTRRKESESYPEYVARAGSCWKTRWIKMADLLDNMDTSRLETVTDDDKSASPNTPTPWRPCWAAARKKGTCPRSRKKPAQSWPGSRNEAFAVRVKDNFPYE